MWLMERRRISCATGQAHTVRSFVATDASRFHFDIEWSGSGSDGREIDRRSGKTIVRVNPAFYRPPRSIFFSVMPKREGRLRVAAQNRVRELAAMTADADDKRVRDNVINGA